MKGFALTLKAPRRNNVGCSPTENISRRIVEAIKARMPWGLGRAMTMAREMSMAVHSSPDQCGSRVPETRRQSSQRSGLSPRRADTSEQVKWQFLQPPLWTALSQPWPPVFCPRHNQSRTCLAPKPWMCSFSLGNSLPFLFTWGLSLDVTSSRGLPRWHELVKNPPANAGNINRCGFDPCVGKIPWRSASQPPPVFLPGESPWTEEPGGLQSMGSQRVGHDWSDSARTHLSQEASPIPFLLT